MNSINTDSLPSRIFCFCSNFCNNIYFILYFLSFKLSILPIAGFRNWRRNSLNKTLKMSVFTLLTHYNETSLEHQTSENWRPRKVHRLTWAPRAGWSLRRPLLVRNSSFSWHVSDNSGTTLRLHVISGHYDLLWEKMESMMRRKKCYISVTGEIIALTRYMLRSC